MPQRKYPVLLAIVLLISLAWLYATQQRYQATKTLESANFIRVADLELGNVIEGEPFHHSFTMHNPHREAIVVEKITKTCDCIDIQPPLPWTIPGNGSLPVQMRITTDSYPEGEHWRATQKAVNLTFHYSHVNKESSHVSYTFLGTVQPRLRLEASRISLPIQSEKIPIADVRFVVRTSTEVADVHVEAGPNWALQAVNTDAHPTYRACTIVLKYMGSFAPSELNDIVAISPVLGDGTVEISGKKKIRISGTISHDIVVDRPLIHLGRQPVGAVVQEAIEFRSLANLHFHVVPAKSSESVNIMQHDQQPNIYYLYTRVAHLGLQDQVLTFRTIDSDKQARDHSITIRDFGIND